jgi:hypothetical protein
MGPQGPRGYEQSPPPTAAVTCIADNVHNSNLERRLLPGLEAGAPNIA